MWCTLCRAVWSVTAFNSSGLEPRSYYGRNHQWQTSWCFRGIIRSRLLVDLILRVCMCVCASVLMNLSDVRQIADNGKAGEQFGTCTQPFFSPSFFIASHLQIYTWEMHRSERDRTGRGRRPRREWERLTHPFFMLFLSCLPSVCVIWNVGHCTLKAVCWTYCICNTPLHRVAKYKSGGAVYSPAFQFTTSFVYLRTFSDWVSVQSLLFPI